MYQLTLENILTLWAHPQLNPESKETLKFKNTFSNLASTAARRLSILEKLLPDSYRTENGEPIVANEYFTGNELLLDEKTIRNLFKGKRSTYKKSNGEYSIVGDGFATHLSTCIASEQSFTYKDSSLPAITYRQSMVNNIAGFTHTTKPALHAEHPLFTSLPVMLENETEQTRPYMDELRAQLKQLIDHGSERSLDYALFLMILTAIIQDRITTIPSVFSEDLIKRILNDDPLLRPDMQHHIPFVVENYMGTYNCYLYNTSRGDLYTTATLTMSSDDKGNSHVKLELKDDRKGNNPLEHIYTGSAIYSKNEQMVYMSLTRSNGAMAILSMKYSSFVGDMYYRTGMLMTSDPILHIPVVRRVAITKKLLNEEEITYARGIVKLIGSRVIISENQLQRFKEQFRDAPWFADWEQDYEPLLTARPFKGYCFGEGEWLGNSQTALPILDRLRALMALRSINDRFDVTLSDTELNYPDPDQLHRLMYYLHE